MFSLEKNYIKEQKTILKKLQNTLNKKDAELTELKNKINNMETHIRRLSKENIAKNTSIQEEPEEPYTEKQITSNTGDINNSHLTNFFGKEKETENDNKNNNEQQETTNKEKKTQKENLPIKEYLSPEIYELYIPHKILLKLKELNVNDYYEGKDKTACMMSIRFSNIMSNSLSNKAYLRLYNKIFNQMSSAIYKHSGFINGYLGESIDAVFGLFSEENIQDHAKEAIHCYHKLLEKITLINNYLKSKNIDTLKYTIAIHTGKIIVGKVGNSKDITIMGDDIKVLSAISGLAYIYDYPLICSSEVYDLVQNEISLKELSNISFNIKKDIKLFVL